MPRINATEGFDYRIDCEDFLLYELGRLIEEDRASLEDEEFGRVIEFGIHEHLERRLEVRAELAMMLRKHGNSSDRILRAVEDIESPLRDIPEIVQSYTAYFFEKLEQCSELLPDERITTAADLLLDSPGDAETAEASIGLLGSIRSAVSARILAHVISEPLLEENLENKAYEYLRGMWPLPRPYILYSLKPHAHEDIPFRWFELLIDCEEPSAVDRILEEVVVHGDDPDYREDLAAIIPLLNRSNDLETEDKVLQVLNSDRTPRGTAAILEEFLRTTTTSEKTRTTNNPWAILDRIYAANRQYLSAARLFDGGKKPEAAHALDELLKDDPRYPFALMLKKLL